MIKQITRPTGCLILLLMTSCEGAQSIGLAELRFLLLFVLLIVVALTVISSYKNGGK